LGFCAAVRDVFPETRRQRDWVHKTSNVLDALPKSVHSRAKSAIKEITCAENKAVEAFATEFGAKWPKAVANITSEKETLPAFYDYPAEHWHHLRTTDLIESTFAPVRARDESDERARLASGGTGDDLQGDGSS
jgi:putative transposase